MPPWRRGDFSRPTASSRTASYLAPIKRHRLFQRVLKGRKPLAGCSGVASELFRLYVTFPSGIERVNGALCEDASAPLHSVLIEQKTMGQRTALNVDVTYEAVFHGFC